MKYTTRHSISGKYPLLLAALAVLLTAVPVFAGETAGTKSARLLYFGEIGCSHCDTFFSTILPAAEHRNKLQVEAEAFDILSAEGYARCEKELADRGLDFRIFPVLIIGNNVYQGNSAVESNLDLELAYYAEQGEYRPRVQFVQNPLSQNERSGRLELSVLPVIAAGLIDGINPCAFATMLFFISWISLRGGGRKKMILCGGAFIGGIFLSYLGMGIGLSAVLGTLSGISFLRTLFRIFFTFSAAVLAVLSLLDAWRIFHGQARSMMLQLPLPLKKAIHRMIRDRTDTDTPFSFGLFAGFLGTGILVSLLELACTGQIYLPTIAYMVQTGSVSERWQALFYLIIYNTAFILPLVAVFIVCLAGISQEKLRNFFTRNLVISKLIIAVLFFVLALLIWFA